MRVLIADKLPSIANTVLLEQGFDVISDPSLADKTLIEALKTHDPAVLIVRSTKVNADHICAGNSLSLIVRAGAGVNTIDGEACSGRGVFVTNCPGKNADAVAELAMGLMIAIDRNIPDNVIELRQGQWNKKRYAKCIGIKGRKLGILGTGMIGRGVIRRAQAFDMEVYASSRSLTPERAKALGVHWCESPTELAAKVDILSIHLALTDTTRGLVGKEVIGALRDGGILINTARAEVVDEAALLELIDTKQLRVGLDVFSGEPSAKEAPFQHPLAQHPRVYGTHHIAASTDQAQNAVALEAVRVVEEYYKTGTAPNCVNLNTSSKADHCIVVRHRDRVGVLASVLSILREASINVQEMGNMIFQGGQAASARIQVLGQPSDAMVQRMRENDDIFHVSVVPLSQT
jgi:D-3-phosphoglycerate dehydrogenase